MAEENADQALAPLDSEPAVVPATSPTNRQFVSQAPHVSVATAGAGEANGSARRTCLRSRDVRTWSDYQQGTRDRVSSRGDLARQYFGLEQEPPRTADVSTERTDAVDTAGYVVWSVPELPSHVLVQRPGPPGRDGWLSLERRLECPPRELRG